MEKTAILRVRDKEGNIIDIPALTGLSAYEYAKKGGYSGTEEEFSAMLASLDEQVGGATQEAIDVSIAEHDSSQEAHADIRTSINQLANWEGPQSCAALSIITVNGKRLKFFLGTEQEYQGLSDTLKTDGLFAITTDDQSGNQLQGLLSGAIGVKKQDFFYINSLVDIARLMAYEEGAFPVYIQEAVFGNTVIRGGCGTLYLYNCLLRGHCVCENGDLYTIVGDGSASEDWICKKYQQVESV